MPIGDLSGKWNGYYNDVSKSEYVWAIKQTGGTLAIENVGGKPAKSKGRVDADKFSPTPFGPTESSRRTGPRSSGTTGSSGKSNRRKLTTCSADGSTGVRPNAFGQCALSADLIPEFNFTLNKAKTTSQV